LSSLTTSHGAQAAGTISGRDHGTSKGLRCYSGLSIGRPREASVRWIGIVGVSAALISTSADAFDEFKACPDLLEEVGATATSSANGEQPLLLKNRCEAVKREELRAPLMRIPQETEDPMELSFGIKSNGGMLRFKVPFSF
jgi:hypothetical protein